MLSSSSSRDNWERLVVAVMKKQQIWELCHQQSISTISSSDDLSEWTHSFSVPPSPRSPPKVPSFSQVKNNNNASSRPLTRGLFSAWNQVRKIKEKYLVDIPEHAAIHLSLLQRFSLDELRIATCDFSEKIAWDVYRGWLADGTQVAVKRKKIGCVESDEFQREVEINSIVAHPNVIQILGFCITPNEHLLVYPLMVNGSVASYLRYTHESQSPLNWPTRKGIALGAARGLAYLHEEICDKKIIHRDIKSANILLDDDFNAVLAEFGFGIVAEHDPPRVEVDEICGTSGCIAHDDFSTGSCSEKVDVFGYGVFLLQLISGKSVFDLARLANDKGMMILQRVQCEVNVAGMPPHQFLLVRITLLDSGAFSSTRRSGIAQVVRDSLPMIQKVTRTCMESKWEEIVDANCESDYMELVVRLLVQIALLCTQYDPEKRPKMSEVVRMLLDGDGLIERWEELLKDMVEKENDYSE